MFKKSSFAKNTQFVLTSRQILAISHHCYTIRFAMQDLLVADKIDHNTIPVSVTDDEGQSSSGQTVKLK